MKRKHTQPIASLLMLYRLVEVGKMALSSEKSGTRCRSVNDMHCVGCGINQDVP